MLTSTIDAVVESDFVCWLSELPFVPHEQARILAAAATNKNTFLIMLNFCSFELIANNIIYN